MALARPPCGSAPPRRRSKSPLALLRTEDGVDPPPEDHACCATRRRRRRRRRPRRPRSGAARGRCRSPRRPPPAVPDLTGLTGREARIRRRAALAIGHVRARRRRAAVAWACWPTPIRSPPDGAFALGLLGDPRARAPLIAALDDASPLVQGSAAEALGLLVTPPRPTPVGAFAARIVQSPALAQRPDEADDVRRDTATAACRLALRRSCA